jgi:23S rRNA A2030 N6-methylase RlmJ
MSENCFLMLLIQMLRQLDKTEELRLMEQGSQLIEKQEAEAADQYRRSELEAQEHSQYAGKFKSAEDLEKAYLELQKKLGQKENR